MNTDTKSFYNEGFFQIQRLHYLWAEANNACIAGDMLKWRWILDTIWRELSRDVLKQEEKNFKDNNDWYKDNLFYKTYSFHQEELAKKRENPQNYYLCLRDYEMFLRWLQDSFGKGGKYIDPDEHGID